MAEHIPNDLLIDILARLPVVSLLRFTSVCKSWYSLITSPSFITKHLNQTVTNSRRNDNKLFVRTCDKYKQKESYLLLHDNENFGDNYSELKLPFKHPLGGFKVVGSCNGLVCLADYWSFLEPQIILWNPSIRKSVTLPMPCKPQQPHKAVFGFGSHPTTLDYKVVWMRCEIRQSYKLPPKVEVYTRGKRSWRGINSAAPHYMVNMNWSQAFLNGFVNWVAYDEEDGFRNLIMSFNMNADSFSEIKLPPSLAYQPPASLSIKLLGEALAVLCRGERYGGGCCIWIMKEYGVSESWTKLFSSDLLGWPQKALGFRKNGEVLLASADSLASYAPGTKTLANTGIKGSSLAFYVDPFIETLVLI